MLNPRCEAVLSLFQETLEVHENYLIVYQNKELLLKGDDNAHFGDGCYSANLDPAMLPFLLSFITGNTFSVGLDKASIYNERTKQKLLGCTILLPACVLVEYYESGSETSCFGEELSCMLRSTLSLYNEKLNVLSDFP